MNAWRFLWTLDRGHRRWTLAGLGLALLAASAAIGLVATAGWLITASALAGVAASAGIAVTLEIFAPGALVRAFAVLRTVSRYGERLLIHEAIFRIISRLRQTVFAAQAARPFATLLEQRRASVMTRLMQDAALLESVHAGLLLPTLSAAGAGLLLALFAHLWLPGPWAWLIMALTLSLLATCVLAARLGHRTALRQAARLNRSHRQLLELLDGHRELYFADPARQRQQRWLQHEQRLQRWQRRRRLGASVLDGLQQLLLWLALAGALLLGARILPDQPENGPRLALLVIALLAAASLWSGLALAWRQWPEIRSAIKRLRPNTDPAILTATSPMLTPHWQLRQLTLRRGVTEQPLIESLDFTLPAGSCLHIHGASGSGKSSLAALLAGLLSPDRGEILLGGQPLARLPEAHRLQNISLLAQDNSLLSASLRDNLTLANPETDDATLCTALSAVGLQYLCASLDEWIGLNGRPLSGGEARRVALIRCLLSGAPTLILDEPYRGLDSTLRDQVAGWIRLQQGGRTLILLDHQPHAVQPGDRQLALGE